MANYYVSNVRGDDSSGTGTATSPWKTISKAVGSSPAITLAGGTAVDRLYVEPGLYREVVPFGLSPTSTNTFELIGDYDGSGFLAGGYSTPATGLVEWRGWSNDTTRITTSECLIINNKSYGTIQGIKFIGSGNSTSANGCVGVTGTSANWTVQDCVLVGTQAKPYCITLAGTAGQAMNVTVQRCVFATNGSGMGVQVNMPTHSAEYSANVLVQNCRFLGCSSGVRFTPSGAAAFNPTGLTIQNCSFYFSTTGFTSQLAVGINNTTPLYIYNCTFAHGSNGLVGNANATHITEDGNVFDVTTPRSGSISAGANSVTTACPAYEFEDGMISGLPLRPFGTPSATSVVGAFGGYGTPPSVDGVNRLRPDGFASANVSCGALERHDTMTVQSGTVQAGTNAGQLGPGNATHEFLVPVAALSTTLTVYTRSDTNYGTATPPVFEMFAAPACGVAALTTTAPANTNTWNQLTLGPFTPTAAGWVRVRITAKPNAATGICYVDTFAGATGDPSDFGSSYQSGVPRFLASLTTNVTNNYIFNSEC